MAYRNVLLFLALMIPATTGLAADADLGHCDLHTVFGETDTKQYLSFDAALRDALRNGDPTALAVLVKFPLNVYSPGEGSFSINDPSTLQLRYDEIIPQSLRDAVLKQEPSELYCHDVGADYYDKHAQVHIDQVSVGSAKEFRLVGVDLLDGKSTEPPKTTWGVDFICHTPKYRIVVDSTSGKPDGSSSTFRYRAWVKPHGATDKPDMELVGGTDDGGGTGVCYASAWTFRNGKIQYAVSRLGCTDGSEPKGAEGRVDISSTDDPDNPTETLWCYQ